MADPVEVKLGADSSDLKSGIEAAANAVRDAVNQMNTALSDLSTNAQAKTVETADHFKAMGTAITQVFAMIGGVAVIGTIKSMVEQFAGVAEQLDHVAQKTGVTTEFLQGLKFSGDMVGVSFEGVTRSMRGLVMAMSAAEGGNAKEVEAFRQVGLSVKDLQSMSPEQVILKIADAFENAKDGTTKMQEAIDLFKRTGIDLIPLLNLGSQGIKDLNQAAKDLGITMSGPQVEALARVGIEMKIVNAQHDAMKRQFVEQLIPAIEQITGAFQALRGEGEGVQTFGAAVGSVFRTLANVAGNFWLALKDLGDSIGAFFAQGAALASGDLAGWRAIGAARDAQFKQNEADFKAFNARMEAGAQDNANKLKTIAQSILDAGKKAPTGEFTSNAAKTTPAPALPSMMPEWQAELAAEKVAYETKSAQQGAFQKYSIEMEKDFWNDRLTIADSGNKDLASVQKIISTLELKELNDAQEAKLEGLRADIANTRKNYDERMAAAQTYYNAIALEYGEDSKQAAKAEAEKQKIAIDYAHQLAQAEVDLVAAKEKADLQAVKTAEAALQGEFDLREVSKAQMLTQQQALEDQRYRITKTAIDDRIAIMAQDPTVSPQALQKVKDQLLAIEETHATNVMTLTREMANEASKYSIQAFDSIQSALATFASDVSNHTKSVAQAFQDMAASIAKSINDLIAKKWVEQLFGAGTSGGAGIGSILGMLGLGGASGATNLGVSPSGSGGLGIMDIFSGGSFATGTDYVPSTGFYQLHQGEKVIPAGSNRGVNVVNNFVLAAPPDTRSQQQIASAVGQSVQRAMGRNT